MPWARDLESPAGRAMLVATRRPGRCRRCGSPTVPSEHPLPSGDTFGMVRTLQRTFVPAPPPGTEVLELRFAPPSTPIDPDAPPLVVSTVVL